MLSLLALGALAPTVWAQSSEETILGVYMFHRHGDRVSNPPDKTLDKYQTLTCVCVCLSEQ